MEYKGLKLKCIVVDDEQYARDLLAHHIGKTKTLQLVAKCKNAFEAESLLKRERIDLIFLDIQMPHKTGLDFLQDYTKEAKVVLTTAYREYALKGFEFEVLDYLLKPILEDRFLKCVQKIESIFSVEAKAAKYESILNDDDKSLVIKSGYESHRIQLSDILYIESVGEYIRYHTAESKYLVLQSLSKLAKELPDSFLQVHRSFIIPKLMVKSKVGHTLHLKNGQDIPIGKTYRSKINSANLFE
ncbi:LytR/AlgR family response regulator transcription factor [Roseivirga misakiensis]|uniref:DNA-binding response regulator n=1 Tax=Roseivirga misakiensis TaxID=1563681 RepID=A0A1E5SXW0_9BACT|nr:LytTR family DNA-binding domain-containing protein [Roseivirga misakiensis]OEK03964.1 hypothetical protein BFP71_10710 [Roseivirga misakiensis]